MTMCILSSEGAPTIGPSKGNFLPSTELLGAATVCLVLLVFLITNTVLCCHYRRRHGWF